MMLQAWHTYFWAVSPILLCRTSQAPSGWMGSVGAQPFSDLSRDVQTGSSLGSGQVMSGAWFPPDMTLCIQAKEFNLCFIRPENFVSHGLRVLQVPFGLLLRSGFRLATLPYRPDWWSAAEIVVLLEGSPLSTEQCWSTVRVTIRFLVTSLTKALLPRLLRLAGRPALGRVLVVAHFFHLWMIEATVLIGTFNAAEMFLYPSPDLCLDTILSQRSTDNSLDFMAWFVL